MSRLIDITGKKYGRLTVVKKSDNHISGKGQNRTIWHCICECGNQTDVTSYDLRSGHIRSCGCLLEESRGMSQKKYNKFDEKDNYVIIYTTKNGQIIVDKDDYDKIKNVCWSIDNHGYAVGNMKGKSVRMHRLITDCPKNFDVDHINHNTCDNRKKNLRIVTRSQNNMNHKVRLDNVSGITGVRCHKCGKWEARIAVKTEEIYLGLYDTKELAIAARKEAEKVYFGNYAYKEI